MSATPRPADSGPFTESQLNALLKLLGDEDPAVHRTIRARLLAGGESVFPFLERHRLHPDPAVRLRVRELLRERAAARYDGEFLQFVLSQGEHLDLEEGIWRFTRTTYPDTNVEAFQAQLDEWAARVQGLLPSGFGPGVALDAMNEVLFEQLQFRGNAENYFDPANSYLNRVMDRRLGIPISLSAVYLLVAKRVQLPMVGIGMPAHFLCRFQTAMAEVYIDPFHRGQLLTRLDCRKRLLESAIGYDERHLAPLSSRRILQRMIANLHLIHKERRNRTDADRLQRYLVALSR